MQLNELERLTFYTFQPFVNAALWHNAPGPVSNPILTWVHPFDYQGTATCEFPSKEM